MTLEIMAAPQVRAARESGACVLVLSRDLDRVVFANAQGRALVGQGADADASSALPPSVARQIVFAARVMADRGRAKIRLRPATSLNAEAVIAEIERLEILSPDGPLALMTAPTRAKAIDDPAAALLADAARDGRPVAVFSLRGMARTSAGFPLDATSLAAFSAKAARLLATGGPLFSTDVAGQRVTIAAIASDAAAIRIEGPAEESVAETAIEPQDMEDAPLAPAASPVPAGYGSFSVKRSTLPASRSAPRLGLGALIARWRHREQDSGLPQETGDRPTAASIEHGFPQLLTSDPVEENAAAEVPPMPTEPLVQIGALFVSPADLVGSDDIAPMPAPVETASKETTPVSGESDAPAATPTRVRLHSHWDQMPAAEATTPRAVDAGEGEIETEPMAVSPADALEPSLATPIERQAPAKDDEEPASTRVHTTETGDGQAPFDADGLPDRLAGDVEDAPSVLTEADPWRMPEPAGPTVGGMAEGIDESGPSMGPPGQPSVFSGETALQERVPVDPNAGPVMYDEAPMAAPQSASPPQPELDLDHRPAEPAFVPRFGGAPVRFVWQIDGESRFRSISPDFAAAVGPAAADVIGRRFSDVASVFDFDANGEIARLLERRDTWSGRCIFWPVEGSERKVPVDLAALPIYARDRSFDGFRGFGIVRMNEAVEDPAGVGLILADRGGDDGFSMRDPADPAPQPLAEPALPALEPTQPALPALELTEPAMSTGADIQAETEAGPPIRPLIRVIEADEPAAFGRRTAPPDGEAEAQAQAQVEQKVIHLEERRRPREGVLSQAEEAAFREIGKKLGHPTGIEAESPGALRFADSPTVNQGGESGTERKAIPQTRVDDNPLAPEAVHHPEPDPVFETAGNEAGFAPLATGPVEANAATTLGTDAGEAEDGAEDFLQVAPDFGTIFASLPLPILVQMRERLVYCNQEFEGLTGYRGVAALNEAGGLGALFSDPAPGEAERDGEVGMRLADGTASRMRVRMQRVALSGRSALLMSFAPTSSEAETQAEQAAGRADLERQVEELRTVLDTATDGIVLLDPPGNIRSMNGSAHALFDIEEDRDSGRHLSTLFAHESQRIVIDYLDMLRDDGLAGILNDGREVIGRVAQGGFIPLFITIGRLADERGWCVVIRDIAHWKRIEADLVNARRQAEAASLHKSRFLANISHELRTPLNAIIGFADVMASECFGPIGNERYLEYLGDIKRSGHHVLDLVNDLLDISKIEAGKIDMAFEAVSLNEVVAEVVALMQPQANRERVIVRSNLPSSVPPVVADRRTIRQISLNLIANSIRFTPAGGQIIVSTIYTNDGDVMLRFRDSGIGMTEQEVEIALTPFQQVHSSGVGNGEGTGLGLPLTKAMVEANRATFSITSTPGEGTLVEIGFPSQRVLAD